MPRERGVRGVRGDGYVVLVGDRWAARVPFPDPATGRLRERQRKAEPHLNTEQRAEQLRRQMLAARDAPASIDQLPALCLQDLRGSAASILLALGVPLPAVMQILGHRKASVTLEHYARALAVS